MDIFLAMFKEAFSNYYFSMFIHILLFIYVVLIVSKVIFDNKITEDNKEKVNLEKTKDNKEKVGIKKTKEDKLKLFKDSFLSKVNWKIKIL